MTKRELENWAMKQRLIVVWDIGHKPLCWVGKSDGRNLDWLADCNTKAELEQFLHGVKVGKEMG